VKLPRTPIVLLFLALSLVLGACVDPENAPNQPPVALIDFDPPTSTQVAPAVVTLDARRSKDVDGQIIDYRWYVDGAMLSTDESFTTTFATPGSYEVRLEVADDEGAANAVSRTYRVLGATLQLPDGDFSIDMTDESTVFVVESSEAWTLSTDAAWLTLTPTAGTPGETYVTATVDATTAPGPDPVAAITITGDLSGNTATIYASMLTPGFAGPFSDQLELRTVVERETTGDFRIMNPGTGKLRVELTPSAAWLAVTPAEALIAPGEDAPFYATATCDAPGQRVGYIDITSNASNTIETVEVTLDCLSEVVSDFEITLGFFGDIAPTTAQRAVFERAAARWAEVIVGDLPDLEGLELDEGTYCRPHNPPALYGDLDDLHIWVKLEPIDGPSGVLGMAGPCVLRSPTDNNLPAVGVMIFDIDDFDMMEERGILEATILHEMGHVLGIGTLWELANTEWTHVFQDFIDPAGQKCNADNLFADNRYNGALAGFHHAAAGGTGKPRVENVGGPGTACAHWHEETYINELMTGWIGYSGNHLSAITIGSLADLGYEVEYALADPYTVPLPGALRTQSAGMHLHEALIFPDTLLD